MARIRTIKPEFFRHEGLYELERATGLPIRVAFAGLWTACDREGRFKWAPRTLKLDCLPFDDVDFSRVLDALTTRGFILKYTSEGVDFGCVPSWNAHQVINNRESTSLLPAPEDCSIESTTSTRAPRVDDACPTPLVQEQGEGKGKEGKGREVEQPPRKRDAPTQVSKPDDVDQQTWIDWVALRKAKRSTVSETVVKGARQEAAKAGMTLDDFLQVWCRRGSQGLEADWLKPNDRQSLSTASPFAGAI